jgi:hypothetical protein
MQWERVRCGSISKPQQPPAAIAPILVFVKLAIDRLTVSQFIEEARPS